MTIVVAGIGLTAGCAWLPRPRPNVLFLLIDALRADHLGFAGYSRGTSPCLDSLAASGVAFTSATAQAPFTMTSVPSLLSGRYPGSTFRWTSLRSDSAATEWAVVIGSGVRTLPALLARHGYTTGAFITNPVAAAQIIGIRQQFDHFDDRLRDVWTRDSADRLNRLALTWIASLGDAPWFCFLHYMDVHDPYDALPEVAARFSDGHQTMPQPNMPWMKERVAQGGPTMEELRHIVGMYDAEISYLDSQICALLGRLADMGRRENLLVIVAADHGDEFLEHGGLGHGHSLYQELLRCPLILSWPGHIDPQAPIDAPVENVDIVPTVLDLIGIPSDDGIQGRSLQPWFRGSVPTHPVFSETRGFSVRRGQWKLWHQPNGHASLYDLTGDPSEAIDLGAQLPDTVHSLVEDIKAWHSRMKRPALPLTPSEHVDLNGETVRLLRQLGYVE